MKNFKFIVTRQLTSYSGSDKYINLNSLNEINRLYNSILDNSISLVNSIAPESIPTRNMVNFFIIDKTLNKTYPIHIKKAADGLRFTITEYVNDIKMVPNTILIISIKFGNNSCSIFIKTEYFYKYILEKHASREFYRILNENPPSNRIGTTQNTDIYLSQFNIIKDNDTNLNWRGNQQFSSYYTNNFSKKYIGIPYSSELDCDEFDNIEEIL